MELERFPRPVHDRRGDREVPQRAMDHDDVPGLDGDRHKVAIGRLGYVREALKEQLYTFSFATVCSAAVPPNKPLRHRQAVGAWQDMKATIAHVGILQRQNVSKTRQWLSEQCRRILVPVHAGVVHNPRHDLNKHGRLPTEVPGHRGDARRSHEVADGPVGEVQAVAYLSHGPALQSSGFQGVRGHIDNARVDEHTGLRRRT
mmetsp:Transcript_81787/g.227727  ORF Transcript_81787/g.227727 Transcript_81787/m.227727 type:complete len:202 (-) Transcript_81787:409-1014(-)